MGWIGLKENENGAATNAPRGGEVNWEVRLGGAGNRTGGTGAEPEDEQNEGTEGRISGRGTLRGVAFGSEEGLQQIAAFVFENAAGGEFAAVVDAR